MFELPGRKAPWKEGEAQSAEISTWVSCPNGIKRTNCPPCMVIIISKFDFELVKSGRTAWMPLSLRIIFIFRFPGWKNNSFWFQSAWSIFLIPFWLESAMISSTWSERISSLGANEAMAIAGSNAPERDSSLENSGTEKIPRLRIDVLKSALIFSFCGITTRVKGRLTNSTFSQSFSILVRTSSVLMQGIIKKGPASCIWLPQASIISASAESAVRLRSFIIPRIIARGISSSSTRATRSKILNVYPRVTFLKVDFSFVSINTFLKNPIFFQI